MSVLSLEEQRQYYALEQKILRARLGAGATGVQGAEVEGEVVERTDDPDVTT
jgi:hypothetical protein